MIFNQILNKEIIFVGLQDLIKGFEVYYLLSKTVVGDLLRGQGVKKMIRTGKEKFLDTSCQ